MSPLFKFFETLKSSYSHKKSICSVKPTAVMLRFVKILRRECLIYGSTLSNKDSLSLFLRYSRKRPLISNIKIISKGSSRKYIKKNKHNPRPRAEILITSSSLGFETTITTKQCTGELICKLW